MGDNLIPIDFGVGRTFKKFGECNVEQASCFILDNDQVKVFGKNNAASGNFGEHASWGDEPGEMGASLPAVSLPTGTKVQRIFSSSGAGAAARLDNSNFILWGSYVGDTANSMGDNLTQIDLTGGKTLLDLRGNAIGTRCFLDSAFEARCNGGWWGGWTRNAAFGGNGGVSDGNNGSFTQGPVNFGPNRKALQIALGVSACALLDNFRVKCWGTDALTLGLEGTNLIGNTAATVGDNMPYVNLGSVSYPVKIDGAGQLMCALFANGLLKCWGNNSDGALGQGDSVSRGSTPGTMGDALSFIDVGTGRTVKDFSVSFSRVCVIRDDDSLVCWGLHTYGSQGLGTGSASIGISASHMGDNLVAVDLNGDIPVKVYLPRYPEGTYAGYHSCVLLEDASVKCWGSNALGELGLGDTNHRGDQPGEMGANLPAVDIQW